MKLHFKAVLLLVLVALLAVPMGVLPAQAQDQIELRVAWWGSQTRHDLTTQVIDMFQKANPNIKITFEFAGWDDYWTKMTTQASANNLPDIMQQDYSKIAEWQTRKLIVPLDDYVKDNTLNFKNVADSALSGGRLGGKLYAINLGMNSQFFALDVDCFTKAGVDLPKVDWTWDDMEKTALDLTAKLKIPALSAGMTNDQLWRDVYLSLGQWPFSDDGTTLGYTDDKPLVDYFKMLLRLQNAKAMISREQENANKYTLETDPIVKSQTCMLWMAGSNQIVALYKAAGDSRNIKMQPIPRTKGFKQAANYLKPSMFWSITSSSKHPKEAAMFIDYFTNSVDANKVLLAERGVPISSVVREAIKDSISKPQFASFDYIAQIEKIGAPIPVPDPAGLSDLVNNVYIPQVIDPIFYGQITPEDGVALLRKEATAILAKNKK